jgi:hypothetical protein
VLQIPLSLFKTPFLPSFHSISVLMLTNNQVRDQHLSILRLLDRGVCALPLSISGSDTFEGESFLALPQILPARYRGWHLWVDRIVPEHKGLG